MVEDTQCKFNLNSYKMVFVVNSSSYIYNRRALRRAQQSRSCQLRTAVLAGWLGLKRLSPLRSCVRCRS
ncbi:hypothetical protein V5799_009969 [Amblyomma americanum]|uniref:Uncharacterized protein n=1 Tax=Amblyomma americanum TaxID=6943 RepID=A0AAQ4F8Y7_AMBAM